MLKVHVSNRQSDLKLDKRGVRLLVKECLSFLGIQADEIGVHFVSPLEISSLHDEYFGDPSVTDCITLPANNDPTDELILLGDVFICPRTAVYYASIKKLNPYEECSLYLVHTLLHLIGFDDMERKDRQTMRAKERQIMRHLKAKRLLLQPLSL